MSGIVVIPATILSSAAAGCAVCLAFGVDPHPRQLVAAATTSLLAGELALIPMLVARNASQQTVVQAGLLATVALLLLTIAAATGLILLKTGLGQPFLFWLAGFYWASLIVMVILLVRQLQSAPAAKQESKHQST